MSYFSPNKSYAILGLRPGASYSEIRKAFHRFALTAHPDKNKASSTAQFCHVKAAYEHLISITPRPPEQEPPRPTPPPRTESSKQKSSNVSPPGPRSPPAKPFPTYSRTSRPQEPATWEPPPSATSQALPKSAVIEHSLHLTLEEVLCGNVMPLIIDIKNNGQDQQVSIDVPVKPGVEDGARLVFSERGHRTQFTTPGDVVVIVHSKPHAKFKRLSAVDIGYTYNIRLLEIVINGTVGMSLSVPTLDGGLTTVVMDEVITPTTEKRIAGFGLPYANESRMRGDLVLNFNIIYPSPMTLSVRRQFAEAWLAESPFESDFNTHFDEAEPPSKEDPFESFNGKFF